MTLPDVELRYRPGVRLPGGSHRVVVRSEGYQEEVHRVDVSGDTRVPIALQVQAGSMRVFDGMEFVWVPAGQFRMGCVSGRDCQDYEFPVHEVRISRGFWLGKYEVTFAEYDRFTAATGRARADDRGWGRGRRPVINVSWEDAVAYTEWLSGQTGERYRLPSEAEWEYAARAESVTAYSWGNEIGRNRASCWGCQSQAVFRMETVPVGSFGANRWGLHDMHGNVWEWVQDCLNTNYRGAPGDGSAWGERELFPARVAGRLVELHRHGDGLRGTRLEYLPHPARQLRVPRGPDDY